MLHSHTPKRVNRFQVKRTSDYCYNPGMIDSVVREFAITATHVEPLGNAGGFSGSAIWKISSNEQQFCLKRWPESFRDRERIDWIHRVIVFAAANGCPEVVKPLASKTGTTYVEHNHCYWELTPWVAASTTLDNSATTESIHSAVNVIARFHQATARFHFNFATSRNASIVVENLRALDAKLLKIEQGFSQQPNYLERRQFEFFRSQAPVLANRLASQLVPLAQNLVPVQPVIRDLRAEHLFIDENQTAVALIDFGAMQIDSVACDLARLSSSLGIFDAVEVQELYNTYCKDRYSGLASPAQTKVELELLNQFLLAIPVVSIANWMNWLFVEHRQFESKEDINNRLQKLFTNFESVISKLN